MTTTNAFALPDLDDLFRLYHRELMACAYRRLKDRDAASDVVQEAFLRCLSHSGAEAAQPRFFLRRVVDNLAIDVLRARQRRASDLPVEDLANALVDPNPTAERVLAARQDYIFLKRALDELRPATRTALLLSRVEGLTHAEIAARMGISTSMVARHIMNAVAHCLLRFARAGR